MKRLTKRSAMGGVDRVCYTDDNAEGYCYKCNTRARCNAAILDRLAELEDKLENEMAFELPCPLGGTLWRICKTKNSKHFVRDIELNENNLFRIVFKGEFGKTVFLTKEQALEVAEDMNDEN